MMVRYFLSTLVMVQVAIYFVSFFPNQESIFSFWPFIVDDYNVEF